MKFYNPFKAHIVEFENGTFAVRRWNLIWEYKERETFDRHKIHWWNISEYIQNYCIVNTYEEAMFLLQKKNNNPMRIKKIHG